MPGGRIWYGCGRPVPQLLNCYVLPTEDSREGWAKMVGDNIIISGMGGGIGENYGNIRPRGAPIAGTGGFATGSVSVMRIENSVLNEIRNGASRRAARMMSLPINHPDIEEFIAAKADLGELNNANVSVIFDENPMEFFQMVREDREMDLVHRGKVYKTISARKLWNSIVHHALKHGEPGLLNGWLANRMNNLTGVRELVTVNPCGEQWLQPYSTCCLSALVLPRFVKESKSKDLTAHIDWERLHDAVATNTRFLDDVLSVTQYPTQEIKQESLDTRRIGGGIMGLHYMLIMLGLKYSSPEARDFCDKLGGFIKHAAYDTSVTLAAEKGPFPLWDWDKASKSEYIQRLKPSMRNKIRTYGLRNCSLLTIAPTGTTGMVQGVSTGIEPIFGMGYERWRRVGEERTLEIVTDPMFKKYVDEGKDTSVFESSADIDADDHLAMQHIWQQHIDNAISKTINLPQGKYTEDQLSDLYMKWLPDLKGLTIYPEGSRGEEPLKRLPIERVIAAIHADKVVTEISDDCPTGTCEIPTPN
jgi:ribonucleoside-diphosphate reductase alpha chain